MLNVSTHLTLISPALGEISLRKALPICAAANGSFPPLNSNSLLKLTNIPCAVSGRRNLADRYKKKLQLALEDTHF